MLVQTVTSHTAPTVLDACAHMFSKHVRRRGACLYAIPTETKVITGSPAQHALESALEQDSQCVHVGTYCMRVWLALARCLFPLWRDWLAPSTQGYLPFVCPEERLEERRAGVLGLTTSPLPAPMHAAIAERAERYEQQLVP